MAIKGLYILFDSKGLACIKAQIIKVLVSFILFIYKRSDFRIHFM